MHGLLGELRSRHNSVMQALNQALQAALQKVFMHFPSANLVCSPLQHRMNGLRQIYQLCVTKQATEALVAPAQRFARSASSATYPSAHASL